MMHEDAVPPSVIDGGAEIRWGRSATDYSMHRPDPPSSLYEKLQTFGIGTPGQRILDLGTGTGALALQFARMGCMAAGGDVDDGQIAAARLRANEIGLSVAFDTFPAESIPFDAQTFDVVTANQCWPYFNRAQTLAEVRRVLRPGGRLVISSFSYLPRQSDIARGSEAIVLRYSPHWSGRDWDGKVSAFLGWAGEFGRQTGMFTYDEDVPFTRESWRGRMRALRAIGPSLPADQVAAFDAEHAAWLDAHAPVRFVIPHRITAHVLTMCLPASA